MDLFDLAVANKLAGGGGGGGDIDVDSLTVTENGKYTASAGHAYSPVTVSVPQGVFPSGTSQITSNGIYDVSNFASASVNVPGIVPSGTSSITANGIYDITSFASVDVNVSGGGGGGITADDIAMRTISGVVSGSATNIPNYTFQNCSQITGANFSNVISIGASAFMSCYALSIASFTSVSFISDYAFASCRNLITASFPNLISINGNAFKSCSSLTTVNFPNATKLGTRTFDTCSNLTEVNIPKLSAVSTYAFCSCYKLKRVDFPALTSRVEGNAFQACSALSVANLGTVPQIYGSYNFSDCKNLKEVYLLYSSVVSLSNSNAFAGTPMATSGFGFWGSIYVPASLVDSYKTATNWSYYSNRITSYVE